MATTSRKENILHGEVRAFIGAEGAALPAIDGTLDADGVLGFLSEGTDEIQNLTLGTPTSGSFTLRYIDAIGIGYTTAAIAFDATDAAIQLALGLLEPIGVDGIVVSTGTDFVFTFSGSTVSARPHNILIIDEANLVGGGGAAVTLTTQGIAIWEDAGYINEGVAVVYTPTYEAKKIDRTNGDILQILTAETMSVEYNLAEKDLLTMDNAIAATSLTVTNQASSVPGQVVLGLGDGFDPTKALALQGKDAQGLPRLWYFPSTKQTGESSDKQDKNANDHTVMWGVLSNMSMPIGSRLCQIYDMTAAALA